MKKIFLLLSVVVAMGMPALAQPVRIGGQQWRLVELNGSRVGDSRAYLELDREQAKFSGHTGCNRMFGAVSIRGRVISFSNIGTTRMACVEPRAQRTETALLTALKNVDRVRQTGSILELTGRGRVMIKFVTPVNQNPEEPVPSAVQLEDKKWVLESIGSAPPVGKIGRTAFVVFDKNKASAGGNSSCNVFGGSYSAAGATLHITEVISTMRACIEDSRMDIERQFLDALRETNRYKIDNGKLMLYQNDRLLLTMTGEAK